MRLPIPHDFAKRLHDLDQKIVIGLGRFSRRTALSEFDGKEVKVSCRDAFGGWQVRLVEDPKTLLVVQTGQLRIVKDIDLGDYL